jgi:dihydroorotate dehydrogenase (NAD+) catalytic subunit
MSAAPLRPPGAAVAADEVDLAAAIGPLRLPHPVLTAAGAVGWGPELDRFAPLAELGAFVTPTLHLRERSGRAAPRLAPAPSGLLSATGLPGPGAAAFAESAAPALAERGARLIVSIAGATTDELVALARQFYAHPGVAALEVHLGAPAADGRPGPAVDPVAASRAISGLRRAAHPSTPIVAKLSPEAVDIVALARACVDAGADALALIGPLPALALDLDALRPALEGGLSGPAIRPIALRCVWRVHQALPAVPLIGMGGIASGRDALAFLLAGASAVAVGTAALHDPSAPVRIRAELAAELGARGFGSAAQAVGFAHRGTGAPEEQEGP